MKTIKFVYRTLVWVLIGVTLIWLGAAFVWKIRDRARIGTPMGTSDRTPLQGLADFGPVPNFSLTERSGKPVRLQDLAGHIWIVNFIYTACTETCPLQSTAMATLQAQLDTYAKIKLISISIDPERDNPAVLSRYANRFGAKGDRWLFLTGARDIIYELAQKGFRLSATPVVDDTYPQTKDFIHSSRLVLVDGAAKIRGYYASNDAESLRQLSHDVKSLLNGQKIHG